jgi:hypothetical protein
MPSPYRAADWYWIVAGSTTQVYTSARTTYVPVEDATYQAWLAVGNYPSRIASEQELWDVLNAAGVPLPAGAAASDTEKTRLVNTVDRVSLQIAFNHENRLRVLEGRAAVTMSQFITAIKSLL